MPIVPVSLKQMRRCSMTASAKPWLRPPSASVVGLLTVCPCPPLGILITSNPLLHQDKLSKIWMVSYFDWFKLWFHWFKTKPCRLLLDPHNMMGIDNFDRLKNQDLSSLQDRGKFPDHYSKIAEQLCKNQNLVSHGATKKSPLSWEH